MIENESKIIDFVLLEIHKMYPNAKQYIDMNRGILTGSTISHLIYKFLNPSHVVPKSNDLDIFMVIDESLKDKFKITKDIIEDHYFPENEHYEFFSTLYDKEVNITFVQKSNIIKSDWKDLISNFDINLVQVAIDIKNKKIIKTKEYDRFLNNEGIFFSNYIRRKIFRDIMNISNFPYFIGQTDSICHIFSYLRILKKKDEFKQEIKEDNLIEKIFVQKIINNGILKLSKKDILNIKDETFSLNIGKKKINALKKHKDGVNKYFNFRFHTPELIDEDYVSFNLNTKSPLFKEALNLISENKSEKSKIETSLKLIEKHIRKTNNLNITSNKNRTDESYCYNIIKNIELKKKIEHNINNENIDFFEKFLESIYAQDMKENSFLDFLHSYESLSFSNSKYIHALISKKTFLRNVKSLFFEPLIELEFKNKKNIIINEKNIKFIEKLFLFDSYLEKEKIQAKAEIQKIDPIKEFRKFTFLDSCA